MPGCAGHHVRDDQTGGFDLACLAAPFGGIDGYGDTDLTGCVADGERAPQRQGVLVGGVSVALSTLVYKVTPVAGRSVQLAIYSIVVTLLAAPMPTLGGYLPGWLARLGAGKDLRYTFYVSSAIILISSLASRLIPEPDSQRARVLVRHLPALLWFRPWRVGPSGGGRTE